MPKLSTMNGPELLSGLSDNNFTPDSGFTPGGNSVPEADKLHFAIVETCQAIVHREVTATAYVTALLAHARRYPGLAPFVTQIEASAMATARRIDDTLSAGRQVSPPPRPNSRPRKFAMSGESMELSCTEPPPPSCKF